MIIHPNFKQYLPQLYQEVLTARPALQLNPVNLQNSGNVRQGLSQPESEMARTLAALSHLPFSEFFTFEDSRHETYLIGLSHPIYYLHDDLSYQGPGCLGEYYIAVPCSGIVQENLAGFHFIPADWTHAAFRHFHHVLDPELQRKENPLDEIPTTCWGGFAPLLLDALYRTDVAAIFEYTFLFLGQVNLESILCTPFHATQLSLAEYAAAIGVSEHEAFNNLWGNMDDIIF